VLLANGGSISGIHAVQHLGSPLLQAVASGNEECMRIIEEYGANLNIRSSHGVAGTVLLCIGRHSPGQNIVESLLQRTDIDLNTVDAFGRTIVSTL